MSRFDSMFAGSGLPLLMYQAGQAITYTPVTGSAVSLTAIVGEVSTLEEDDDDGRTSRASRDVTIATDPSASTGGVAAPSLADTVTIGSDIWPVESIEALAGSFVRLRVARSEPIALTRAGYRGRR